MQGNADLDPAANLGPKELQPFVMMDRAVMAGDRAIDPSLDFRLTPASPELTPTEQDAMPVTGAPDSWHPSDPIPGRVLPDDAPAPEVIDHRREVNWHPSDPVTPAVAADPAPPAPPPAPSAAPASELGVVDAAAQQVAGALGSDVPEPSPDEDVAAADPFS